MDFGKAKKRKRREKCTQTPPNMASSIHNVNKLGSSNISHVIACANESIYGHEFRNINFQPSPVQHNTPMNFQQSQHISLPAMSLPPMCMADTGPSATPPSTSDVAQNDITLHYST
jgi:hypothetical protein